MASPAPLSKEERTKCWKAKDAFLKCLQMNSGTMQLCEKTGDEFIKSCPSKWVDYFMARKAFNEFRDAQAALGYIRKRSSS